MEAIVAYLNVLYQHLQERLVNLHKIKLQYLVLSKFQIPDFQLSNQEGCPLHCKDLSERWYGSVLAYELTTHVLQHQILGTSQAQHN